MMSKEVDKAIRWEMGRTTRDIGGGGVRMKRTIYVSAEDEAVFEEALSFFGEDNVSRLIIDALKTYIAAKKTEEEVVLEVGTWPAKGADEVFKIAFKGRLLAEATTYLGQTSSKDDRGTDWQIFETSKGKFLLWWRNWSRWENESTTADYTVLEELPAIGTSYFGEVLYDVSSPVPGGLVSSAAAVLGKDITQHLDI